MTNETRDLDRACAEAMGWTQLRLEYVKPRPSSGVCGGGGHLGYDGVAPSLLGNPSDGSSPYPCARHVPRYSTDPSTQAEKLAWFRAQGLLVCHWGVDDSGLDEWTVETEGGKVVTTLFSERDQWDLALARLVCAVAKAKKEQGK